MIRFSAFLKDNFLHTRYISQAIFKLPYMKGTNFFKLCDHSNHMELSKNEEIKWPEEGMNY